MPEYLCAFDLGTTGVKAGVFTPDGQVLGTTCREYSVLYPGPQWIEQSIEEMWESHCNACRELIDRFDLHPHDIAAVGVSSQRATFVPLDKDGKPLTRFIGWQDKRSILQCERMERLVGAERYYQIAGLPIEPTAAVSKILWFKEQAPEIFERTHVFASTQNVHLAQLGVDQAPCDLPDAAYLGLLDVDRLEWSRELLEQLEIPIEKLPTLAPSGQCVGRVSPAAAQATGLAAGTLIVTAGGDLQCAGLGMGVAEPGYVSVGIGTGGGVLTYLDRPLRHPERALNCLPHAVPGAWEIEGICLASGATYRWYRDVLGAYERETAAKLNMDPYEILNADASMAEPGASGLLVMPALAGAGAPNWYPKARGVILGLTLATDKKALTRAVLEGICLEIRWMLEATRKLGTPIEEVRIWGGAAKSSLWNQIAADVYGVPAAQTAVSEAGLVGAAICAGVGAGIFKNAREGARSMVRVERRFEPNPALRGRYDELFDLYQTVYQALRDASVFERLAALQGNEETDI
jgi:xylulokinase